MSPDLTQRGPPGPDVSGPPLSFSLTDIPDFLVQHAALYLNETDDTRERGVRELRQMLRNDKDLEFIDEDAILLMYLRFKKFDVKKAADFFKLGIRYVDSYRYLVERDAPHAIRRVVRANIVGFLPHRDQRGRAIIYIRSAAWDPEKISPEDVILGGIVTIQSAIFNPVNQVAGYIIILDLKDLKVQQVVAMSRWLVFGTLTLQRACPCFMKTFHVINIPPVYKMGWKIVKPILSEKIKKRFVFHKGADLNTLYPYVPREILPLELGGAVPFSNDHWAWDIDNIEKMYHDRLSKNGFKSKKKKEKEEGKGTKAQK